MNTVEIYLYLIACGVTKEAAVLEAADFEKLWSIAGSHNTTALVANSLIGTEAFGNAPAEERKRWQNALNNSIKKTMLFDSERRRIVSFLEENKIWYMLLKGAVINGFYPGYGTREFADNDILFDPAFGKTVKSYFLGRGYSFRSDEFAADEYSKSPFYNFEMHRELFERTPESAYLWDYYENVRERLIKNEGDAYGYHFSDDDFYIYFILHAFKHYDNKGTGVRTVADEYVILNYGGLKLDFGYIRAELDKLGVWEFERTLRDLSEKLFSEPSQLEVNIEALDPEQLKMLRATLSSTTFGSLDALFKKEFESLSGGEKPSKFRYYMRRIFPDISRFKYSHPFVYKHRIVYPFFLIYRMAVNPIAHRKYLKQELEAIKKQ